MKTLTLNRSAGEVLKLENNGDLEVFFIGVGSAFAERHYNTNLLLIKGKDHLLIDFGATGPAALKDTAGLRPTDIRYVCPTHSHSDHIGGLELFAFKHYFNYPTRTRPTMIISEDYEQILWTQSLRGGLQYNMNTDKKWMGFNDFFEPIRPIWLPGKSRETWGSKVGSIKLEMFRTKHVPDNAPSWQASFHSLGFFVDDHVFISMDTRFDEELIELYEDKSDVMFHDVQFFPGAVHAPLADLRALKSSTKAKMHLMHYADNWEAQDITGFAGWAKQGVRYVC